MWRNLSLPVPAAAEPARTAEDTNLLWRVLLWLDSVLEMLVGRGTVSVMAVADSVE